jgi:uncharacterized membrane protein YcaP (DUF421 family)
MDQIMPYLIIAGKSIAIYLFMILAIRLFGKKELAQLSVVDLVFILLISNSVQNAMVGSDSTLLGGMSAAFALFLSNYIFKYFLRKNAGFSRMVQGRKIMLIHEGQVIEKGLDDAMMSINELQQAVREHGVEHIRDVNLAILEVDGNISILSEDYHKKSTKVRKKIQLSHNP